MGHSKKGIILEITIPILILAISTIFISVTDFDIDVSRIFYDIEKDSWLLGKHPLIHFSYVYGPAISVIISIWALFQWLVSYGLPKQMQKRAVALYIILCIVVGPVILVNGIAKETWKRPRPRDIIEFNGNHEFKKVLVLSQDAFRGKSFPSGHASAGFILVLFYFILKRKKTSSALISLGLAIGFGCWMGFVRIAGGGHYASDILWAFGLSWFTALFLYYGWFLAYEKKLANKKRFLHSKKRSAIIVTILLLGIGLLSLRFLYSVPLNTRYEPKIIPLPSHVKELSIQMRAKKGNLNVFIGKPGEVRFQTRSSGLTFPNFKTERQLDIQKEDTHWTFQHRVDPKGIYLEFQSHSSVMVPPNIKINFDLFTQLGKIRRADLE